MKNLYIGNIPEEFSDEQLHSILSPHVPIQKVAIFTDRYSDQSLGFGYLTVEASKEKEIKAKLAGFDLKGQKMLIN